MRLAGLALASLCVLATAACSRHDEEANAGAAPDRVAASSAPADDAAPPPAEPAAAQAADKRARTIPTSLQGRWGLVPRDCTSTHGDAKGLLEIGPDRLRFYESVGKLGEVTEAREGHMRASYAFTGEGMSWQREIDLKTGDGKTLIRQDFGDDAAPQPLIYTRC